MNRLEITMCEVGCHLQYSIIMIKIKMSQKNAAVYTAKGNIHRLKVIMGETGSHTRILTIDSCIQ